MPTSVRYRVDEGIDPYINFAFCIFREGISISSDFDIKKNIFLKMARENERE